VSDLSNTGSIRGPHELHHSTFFIKPCGEHLACRRNRDNSINIKMDMFPDLTFQKRQKKKVESDQPEEENPF